MYLSKDSHSDLVVTRLASLRDVSNDMDLLVLLVKAPIVDWPFAFWDLESGSKVLQKLEAFNDVLGEVYIINDLVVEGLAYKHKHIETIGETGLRITSAKEKIITIPEAQRETPTLEHFEEH